MTNLMLVEALKLVAEQLLLPIHLRNESMALKVARLAIKEAEEKAI